MALVVPPDREDQVRGIGSSSTVRHHGGNTNASGFLDAVGAQTAVIGVGADNDYGHPHPDVLADLAGTRILRTDTGGTISVAID